MALKSLNFLIKELEQGAGAAGSHSHSHGHSHVHGHAHANQTNIAPAQPPAYASGHFHYNGCPNDTEERHKRDDCECNDKKKQHLRELGILAAQSKGRVRPTNVTGARVGRGLNVSSTADGGDDEDEQDKPDKPKEKKQSNKGSNEGKGGKAAKQAAAAPPQAQEQEEEKQPEDQEKKGKDTNKPPKQAKAKEDKKPKDKEEKKGEGNKQEKKGKEEKKETTEHEEKKTEGKDGKKEKKPEAKPKHSKKGTDAPAASAPSTEAPSSAPRQAVFEEEEAGEVEDFSHLLGNRPEDDWTTAEFVQYNPQRYESNMVYHLVKEAGSALVPDDNSCYAERDFLTEMPHSHDPEIVGWIDRNPLGYAANVFPGVNFQIKIVTQDAVVYGHLHRPRVDNGPVRVVSSSTVQKPTQPVQPVQPIQPVQTEQSAETKKKSKKGGKKTDETPEKPAGNKKAESQKKKGGEAANTAAEITSPAKKVAETASPAKVAETSSPAKAVETASPAKPKVEKKKQENKGEEKVSQVEQEKPLPEPAGESGADKKKKAEGKKKK